MTDGTPGLTYDQVKALVQVLRERLNGVIVGEEWIVVVCTCCQVLHEALLMGAPATNLGLMHEQIVVIHDTLHALMAEAMPSGEAPPPNTTLH